MIYSAKFEITHQGRKKQSELEFGFQGYPTFDEAKSILIEHYFKRYDIPYDNLVVVEIEEIVKKVEPF